MQERASTSLPPPPRKNRRRDWGRALARLFCVLFALVGVLPVAGTLVVRSAWARRLASRETERVLREQGVDARYEVGLRLWPLSIELTNVAVLSTDGGAPALVSERISARPKFFALLAGKVVVQEIEASAPRVRVVMRQGELANLDVKLKKSTEEKKEPFHAPFGVVSVTDASLDLDIDGVTVKAQEVDADVTVDDDRERGSSFEVAVRVAHAQLHRRRVTFPDGDKKPPLVEIDDDALCGIDARARIEPQTILVRRLEATGSADLDDAEATLPKCDLPADDKRRVELSLAHLRVRLPEKEGELPRVDGHVKARFPVGIAERLASLPQTDGWVGVDADVRFAEDTTIPDLTGHLEAHGLQLDRYRFAQEIQSDLSVRRNVVTSPKTVVRIADGVATITEVTVEPLGKGVPMKAKLDVANASFTQLMRDLGVSQHPHVSWDLKEVHVPLIHGTLVPLKLDGDLKAVTPNLLIADAAVDSPGHARIISFQGASLATRVAIRPDALEFHEVSASVGKASRIEGGMVSIGFHNDLIVDVAKAQVSLEDIGPLATIPIAGEATAEAHVKGKFNDPRLEADAQIQNFLLGDIPFGNVTAAHVVFEKDVVDLSNVKAQKNKSDYEMPTARLTFGKGFGMDGLATSTALGLRDFFAIWKMDDDPRFTEIDGSIATHANIHLALGGPEDVCGGGFIDVRATAHVKDVKLYGETFDDGDVDLEYKWTDRLAGIEGADVDIRAVTLHKWHPQGGSPVGSILGSGAIQRGGELRGSVVVEALPLSRIDQLGQVRRQLEGSLSAIAQVSGRIDAWNIQGDVDMTPLRVRGVPFGSSHLRLGMTQKPSTQQPTGKTRCGGRTFPPFDKDAYFKDTSSQGELTASGDLLGGTVKLENLTVTREKGPLISGRALVRKLDLGAVSRVALASESRDEDEEGSNPNALTGELSGDLFIKRLKLDDLGTTMARFAPTSLVVERGGQKLQLRPAPVNFVVENDTLIAPPLVFDVNAQNGLKGSFIVRGDIQRLTREANLNLTAELLPVDLGFLVGVVPKVERASGILSGQVKLGGTAVKPTLDGQVKVKDGELAIHGLPGLISEIDVDVRADANEVRVSRASAHFLGGTVAVTDARVPLKERAFGAADAQLVVRGLHVVPAEGVTATLDADLAVSYNAQATGAADARLPHVTGDVLLTTFDYTRPINLLNDLGGFKVGGAKRTVVDTYDPAQDAVVFDVRVRARTPLRIRNNLVETNLAIDSGTVAVTGTNQRVGLRGDLKALPGGRIRLLANEFEIRQAYIRFDDPTRIAPNVDILALTEYRRYTDTSAGAAAGATSASDVGSGAAAGGSGRVGGLWRISIHAYGDADNVRVDMTSDPALSQEDIVLLLTLGLTRSEIDQVQAGVGTSIAFQAAGTVTGADRAVKEAIPVIDDFRFGSQYSSRTGRTEPQVTVGKRFTDQIRGTVSTGLTEDRELRTNIEWRLNNKLSVQGTYDNINDVSSSVVGNVGGGFRWRIEFE